MNTPTEWFACWNIIAQCGILCWTLLLAKGKSLARQMQSMGGWKHMPGHMTSAG
jgi:hypothetical protein